MLVLTLILAIFPQWFVERAIAILVCAVKVTSLRGMNIIVGFRSAMISMAVTPCSLFLMVGDGKLDLCLQYAWHLPGVFLLFALWITIKM